MIVVPHHVSALYVGVCGLGLALACGAGVSREEAKNRTRDERIMYPFTLRAALLGALALK
jgi:hypothetical protein